jgi:two-component system OmpR family response regulator
MHALCPENGSPVRPFLKALRVKVCIVEDSEVVRDCLTAMLVEARGIEVIGAASGADEAVALVRELQPDAIILDLQLHQGSGFDVLKTLRQDGPAPLVLVLTNHASVQHREKCLEAGADYFFDKANEFDKVQEVCHRWLEEKQQEPS